MELFYDRVNGEEYVYLLDGIPEDFGLFDLDSRHSLVALFKPINCVQAVKLDGSIYSGELQEKFRLSQAQSEVLAKLLSRHISNSINDK